jgi:hypothetical protein
LLFLLSSLPMMVVMEVVVDSVVIHANLISIF